MKSTQHLLPTVNRIPRGRVLLNQIGWISTALFALSAWVSSSAATIALLMMATALLMNIRQAWPIVRRDPMFWLFWVFVAYMVLSAAYATNAYPKTISDHLNAAWGFSRLFFFGLLAYWLKADQKRIFWVVGLGGLGLVAGLIMAIDWTHWIAALQGQRVPITRWGHIIIGLFAAVGLLGIFMLGPRLYAFVSNAYSRLLGIMSVLVLTAFFFQIILISQSRVVWIGILLVYPPLLLARYAPALKRSPNHQKRKGLFVSALLITAALILMLVHSYDSIANRLSAEHEDFNRLARLETEGYNQYGFGVRVLLNIYGFKKWTEKPVFGWGPGADFKKYKHVHLHNSYLEILVRLGLAGAVIFITYAGFLIRALFWARRTNSMPRDLWLFLIGVYALTALWSLTDFRLIRMDFRLFWILIAGISYTYYLYRHENEGSIQK